jgi:LmbE family N-acetylglucosaminyl deacetylase
MSGKRILILSPHPDDEVVGFAAQILRAKAEGADVFVLHLTTGVPDISVLWPWDRHGHTARIAKRQQEAQSVAAYLGFKIAGFLDIPTRCLKENLDQAQRSIEQIAFDELWTPAYEGGHQDHDVANYLGAKFVSQGPVFEAPLYNFAGGKIWSQKFITPRDTDMELSLTPREREAKFYALGIYESEKGNLNYVKCNSEACRILEPYDYRYPPHSGKCFYQRFQWVPFSHPRIDFTRPSEVCKFFNNHP